MLNARSVIAATRLSVPVSGGALSKHSWRVRLDQRRPDAQDRSNSEHANALLTLLQLKHPWTRRFLAALITASLFVYLGHRAELPEIASVVGSISIGWIALALALYFSDRLLAAYKWWLLYSTFADDLSLPAALSIYLKSGFLGAALPSTIGSDMIRAGILRHQSHGFAYGVNSVVMERTLGVISLGVCTLIGLMMLGTGAIPLAGIEAVILALALPLLLLTAFVALPMDKLVNRRDLPRVLDPLFRGLRNLRTWLRAYGSHSGRVGGVFALALGQQYLFIVLNWILAQGLGIGISLLDMLWIWPLVMIAVRVPISLLGFGVREAVLFELFRIAGFVPEQGVSLGLASGALNLVFLAIGGLLLVLSQSTNSGKGSAWVQPRSGAP